MNKKVIIISLVLIAICAVIIGVIVFGGNDNTSKVPTGEENIETQNVEQNIEDTTQTNEVEVNEILVNEIQEEIPNDTVENTETSNNTQTTTPTEILPEAPQKGEEKAISIVKADWGEDSSVKFQVETIDANGNYVVSVRDITTTGAKAFYTVNTTTGTFSK